MVCGAHPVKLNMTWQFLDRAINVKSQKNMKIITFFPAWTCTRLLSYSQSNCANCFCSCGQGFSRAEWILLPCWLYLTNRVARHYRRTPAGLESLWSTRHSRRDTACFCSCDLRCSRAVGILLLCCFGVATLGVRHSRRTSFGFDCSYSMRHSCTLFLQLWAALL